MASHTTQYYKVNVCAPKTLAFYARASIANCMHWYCIDQLNFNALHWRAFLSRPGDFEKCIIRIEKKNTTEFVCWLCVLHPFHCIFWTCIISNHQEWFKLRLENNSKRGGTEELFQPRQRPGESNEFEIYFQASLALQVQAFTEIKVGLD